MFRSSFSLGHGGYLGYCVLYIVIQSCFDLPQRNLAMGIGESLRRHPCCTLTPHPPHFLTSANDPLSKAKTKKDKWCQFHLYFSKQDYDALELCSLNCMVYSTAEKAATLNLFDVLRSSRCLATLLPLSFIDEISIKAFCALCRDLILIGVLTDLPDQVCCTQEK